MKNYIVINGKKAELTEEQLKALGILPYHLGNTVKYISRAGKKDSAKTLEDLKKAKWYLDRYIKIMEDKNNGEISVS